MGKKELTKTFELDAGHRLSKHDFKCQNLHGHRYRYEVTVRGDVSEETGMLIDFSNIKNPVMDAFDHNFLFNSADPMITEGFVQVDDHQKKELYLMDAEPTVENICVESAKVIMEAMTEDELERVDELEITIYETPTSKWTEVFSVPSL